jgi:hypothetical protein
MGSYGVYFAGLLDIGPYDAWRRLSNYSNRDKTFCEYVDILGDMSRSFMRKLLLGAVI